MQNRRVRMNHISGDDRIKMEGFFIEQGVKPSLGFLPTSTRKSRAGSDDQRDVFAEHGLWGGDM